MPSYTVLLAAMALGAVWLARPTAPRVLAVSILFSLAWLMEWRLKPSAGQRQFSHIAVENSTGGRAPIPGRV